MKDVSPIEWSIIAAIVAILVTVFIGAGSTAKNFKAACDETGGKTVWDGRQYQCMKS